MPEPLSIRPWLAVGGGTGYYGNGKWADRDLVYLQSSATRKPNIEHRAGGCWGQGGWRRMRMGSGSWWVFCAGHLCPPHGNIPALPMGFCLWSELEESCTIPACRLYPSGHNAEHSMALFMQRGHGVFLTLAKHQIITSKDFRNLSKTTANISYLCLRGRKYFSLIASNICQELVQLWRLVNIPGHRADPQCQHQHSTTVGMQPAPL